MAWPMAVAIGFVGFWIAAGDSPIPYGFVAKTSYQVASDTPPQIYTPEIVGYV